MQATRHPIALWIVLLGCSCDGASDAASRAGEGSSEARDAGEVDFRGPPYTEADKADFRDHSSPTAGAPSVAPCVWGVDAVLEHAGIAVDTREDCGLFGARDRRVFPAVACLHQPSRSAELTVNRCIDCWIRSTYVATAAGDRFHVRLENDAFGDEFREASLDRCDSIAKDALLGVRCVKPQGLYTCSDTRPRDEP